MYLKLVYIANQEEFDKITAIYKPKHRYAGDFVPSEFKYEGPKKYLYHQYKSMSDGAPVTYFHCKDTVERRLVEVRDRFAEIVSEKDILEEFLEQENGTNQDYIPEQRYVDWM